MDSVLINSPVLYLVVSATLFSIGLTGLVIRRNPLVMFMSIELLLNAANLAFVTFGRFTSASSSLKGGPADGPIFAFVVMTIAAAEAVVGLAIIITIFRNRNVVDVDTMGALKG